MQVEMKNFKVGKKGKIRKKLSHLEKVFKNDLNKMY